MNYTKAYLFWALKPHGDGGALALPASPCRWLPIIIIITAKVAQGRGSPAATPTIADVRRGRTRLCMGQYRHCHHP